MKGLICSNCNKEFEDVLEEVELAIPGSVDIIRVKNSDENPCCTDCMYETFTALLEGIAE